MRHCTKHIQSTTEHRQPGTERREQAPDLPARSMSKACNMIPKSKPRKTAQQVNSQSTAEKKVIADCALQLQQIGDRLDLKQKIINALSKLLNPGT
ncbi:hypothetical protein NDU88_005907 [Pleurodeles waltl]|uniref:Phorbol-12-myristate-13-acetate-induced protein 1 n=1 Tax=Pleurodeles waltl TaxID=8319 RepID=A0AAV7W945_PLEWA|nr:hypothetical protein NDU88_005907 [Pleurodeles waltl]